jgi:hypothetical protein
MDMKVLTYSFLGAVSLCSCIPAYNVSKEYRSAKAESSKQKIFVINKDLKQEFDILKHSEIYEIVENSSNVAKLQLLPMNTYTPSCGNAMAGSMLTFGLLPARFPYYISYNYNVTEHNTTKNHQYKLEVYQSLWLFNIFRLGKTYNKEAGKALLGNYIASNK